MRNTVTLVTFLFLSLNALSQQGYYSISGKIVDAITKMPLQSASVFAQNTTIGATTDAEGLFKLALPNGGYNLVITFVGYQTVAKRISSADMQAGNMVIELSRNANLLSDIVIASTNEVKDGWEKYGAFFLENFIGKTKNSSSCTLRNKEVLKFYFSKKRNSLKVLAEEPIEISNAALGYTIKYTLDSFTYDYNTMVTAYQGYPLFVEMQTTDSIKKNNWSEARLTSYSGSILHFMRSLYNKQLKEQGFEINFLVKVKEKEKPVPILNYYSAMNYDKDDSALTVIISPVQNELTVTYNAKPENSFIAADVKAPAKYQSSAITFTPGEPLKINVNGYYFDQSSITKSGYWSWKRIAEMLPYDFKQQ